MEKNADVQQYLDVIKRRKFHFILPGVLVFLVAASIAFILPPVYKSTATILIEAQEIPQDLVRTTVTGYVEERLQSITKTVLSRHNLKDIIKRFDLYGDLRAKHTLEQLVEKMVKAINVEPITAEILNQRSLRAAVATVAFSLSYEGKERQKLAQVTNYLASLFMQAHVKDRTEKTSTAVEFLQDQLTDLRSEIMGIEAKLASYKEKHINELPELMQFNMQTMEKLERQIDAMGAEIKNLINRKIYLEGQLALLEPTTTKVSYDGKRLLTPSENVEVLRSQLLSLTASLSEKHPDVINLKKKLAAMESEVRTHETPSRQHRELKKKEDQLALMLETYSEKHPDVVRLRREVEALKAEIKSFSEKQVVLKVEDEKPDNPAYINLQTRIADTQMEIETAQKEIRLLEQKYENYRVRVENTPRVELKYLDLKRNYSNAKKQYDETMNRLLGAKEARNLEERQKGEAFTLIEEAVTPNQPYKPNRLAILLLGMVLAAGSGIGYGAVAEYLDRSVHLPEELAKITGNTVLAVIPYLETPRDRRRNLLRKLSFLGSTVGLVVIGLVVLHILYRPLDILWLQFMDRLSISF